VSGVPEGQGTTEWTPDVSLAQGEFWWRAYADDGISRGPLTDGVSFALDEGAAPSSVVLSPPSPNPFTGTTEIAFDVGTVRRARLAVYDAAGRLVRTLLDGEAGPGPGRVSWDGTDDLGRRVGNGLYLARLEAGDAASHTKMVLLR
jgi:hypothetical protein